MATTTAPQHSGNTAAPIKEVTMTSITRTAAQLIAGDKTRDGSIVAEVAPQSDGSAWITWTSGYRVLVNSGHRFELARKR